jgi:hypothetical protein
MLLRFLVAILNFVLFNTKYQTFSEIFQEGLATESVVLHKILFVLQAS